MYSDFGFAFLTDPIIGYRKNDLEECLTIARLERVERKAQKELDRLIPILAKQQGVTEQLKAENQLKWVGLMNNVKAQVEEKIYTEIVYVR